MLKATRYDCCLSAPREWYLSQERPATLSLSARMRVIARIPNAVTKNENGIALWLDLVLTVQEKKRGINLVEKYKFAALKRIVVWF